jgi:hypothetical protein
MSLTQDVADNLPSASQISDVDETYFRTFVGPNSDVYLRTLEKMRAKDPALRKHLLTWCWPAFFVTVPWLLYRKLYGYGVGLLVIPVLIQLVFPSIGFAGVSVVVAMLAKPLYVRHVLGRIAKLRSRASSDEEARALAKKAGGVSIAGAIIGAVLMIGLIAIDLAVRSTGSP